MKFVVCAFALFVGVQALSEQQKELAKAHHKECLAVSHVDTELITKAKQGDFSEDAALKEHLYCFSKKAGFQNEAGEIQKDVIKAKLTESIKDAEKADEIIAKCLIQKDTPQETAFQTTKCYYEYTHSSLA